MDEAALHLNDGSYALIEFKPGSKEIDEGATHILQFKHLIGLQTRSVT